MIEDENSLIKKAQNYFKIGEYAESKKMTSESATNYFKSLSAINDLVLLRKNIRVKNHFERFALLKENDIFLYEITDSLFLIYRDTYSREIKEDELATLKSKVMRALKHAGIKEYN